jgi:hypothetical protein
MKALGYIEIESGVNPAGDPFCRINIFTGQDGEQIAAGQLTPSECRDMALKWLEAAEAAEHDAASYRCMMADYDLSRNAAASFIAAIRHHRGDGLKPGEVVPE